jgi:hypothetical protein
MNTRQIFRFALTTVLLPVALASVTNGCASASAESTAKAGQPRYIYLPPETGSRISRRVAINPDGTISDQSSSVIKSTPDAAQELQRRGNVGGSSN